MSKQIEITGAVKQILPEQTGEGKNGTWVKKDFILQTEGEYPKDICISTWGQLSEDANLVEGNVVDVAINIESREYNGKWYTNIKAWKITAALGAKTAPPQSNPNEGVPSIGEKQELEETDDLPF